MNGLRALRVLNRTRRFHGRRAITPLRPKRKRILKTRCHTKVGNVSIQQHTGSRSDGKWSSQDQKEHSEHQGREGNKIGGDHGKWKDSEECEELDQCGNEEDSELTVHPGSLQEVSRLPEYASSDSTNETELKGEGSL